MFEKITKKDFINTLKNNESAFIGSWTGLLDTSCTKIMQSLYDTIFDTSNMNLRSIKKSQTNAIMFSNGSWLYFNDIKKCYKHNNVILTYHERYDSFNEVFKYDIIAYAIK